MGKNKCRCKGECDAACDCGCHELSHNDNSNYRKYLPRSNAVEVLTAWVRGNCRFAQAKPVAMTPDSVKWWSNYSKNKLFQSEQEAREWVFYQRERADKEPASQAFGKIDGPEYNREFSNQIPVYQSGKSWKIGKPVRTRNELRAGDIQVKTPSQETVHQTATSMTSGQYEITGLTWVPLSELLGEDAQSMYSTQPQEQSRIQSLAQEIKQNKWIEAIIVAIPTLNGVPSPGERWIVEGQHRARAMRALGFGRVPAIGIVYEEKPTTAAARREIKTAQTMMLKANVLFAWRPKVEETIEDIRQGRLSQTSGPVTVSKLDSIRGGWFVIDGHHRAAELMARGEVSIPCTRDPHVPFIERPAEAYRSMTADMVSMLDAARTLKKSTGNPA